MGKEAGKEFYIVDKRLLSKAIQNVIEVDKLVEQRKISVTEAIRIVKLSRSTYYKYKDYVKPFLENIKDKIVSLYIILDDIPGMLSQILNILAAHEINILTIIQNVAVDNVATATITVSLSMLKYKELEEILKRINEIEGVRNLRVISNN